MTSCYRPETEQCDHGFMGLTHSLSAVAFFVAVFVFFPQYAYEILGTTSVAVLILVAINLVGACLSVDLDNTASTSKGALGVIGDIMSVAYRSISVIVQTTIRTGRDDPDPNPHRGFFHTIPAALIMGGLTYWLTSFNNELGTVPGLGKVTLGTAIAILIVWGNTHVALAGLFRKQMRKLKKSNGGAGEIIATLLSLSIVFSLFYALPNDLDFWWLGVSTTVGMIIHTMGDCFTKAGSPVLFPIPRKGKLWYTVRFMKIKAGGVVEKYVFVPFFMLVILAGVMVLAFNGVQNGYAGLFG